jgi:hypothetical protein
MRLLLNFTSKTISFEGNALQSTTWNPKFGDILNARLPRIKKSRPLLAMLKMPPDARISSPEYAHFTSEFGKTGQTCWQTA